MTAKEKAKELVDRMKLKVDVIDENNYTAENEYGAIQCALICVDEIIGIPSIQTAYAQGYNKSKSTESYWQEVKQEINKL